MLIRACGSKGDRNWDLLSPCLFACRVLLCSGFHWLLRAADLSTFANEKLRRQTCTTARGNTARSFFFWIAFMLSNCRLFCVLFTSKYVLFRLCIIFGLENFASFLSACCVLPFLCYCEGNSVERAKRLPPQNANPAKLGISAYVLCAWFLVSLSF